ncbi:MAG: SPASM domain-containing protein [Merdibacter sp.]
MNYLEQVLTCGDALSAHSYISYRLWQVEGEDQRHRRCCGRSAHIAVPLLSITGSLRLADRRFLGRRAFEWPSLQRPVRAQRGRCRGLVDMLAIRSNGEVVPCCLDAHGQEVLGNVFEERFADILEKPYTLLLRQGMQQGLLRSPLCQRCTYRQRFD